MLDLSLVMKVKGLDWNGANDFLIKACNSKVKRITEKLNVAYELFYNDYIQAKGVDKQICKTLQIGVHRGKTMLAGSVAFAVRDVKGMKVNYHGIKRKTASRYSTTLSILNCIFTFFTTLISANLYISRPIYSVASVISEMESNASAISGCPIFRRLSLIFCTRQNTLFFLLINHS